MTLIIDRSGKYVSNIEVKVTLTDTFLESFKVAPLGTRTDKEVLMQVLAAALFDDPVTMYVYRTEALRRKAFPAFIESYIDFGQKQGRADILTTPSGEVVGGAVWLGPNRPFVTPTMFTLMMLTNRTIWATLRLGYTGLSRLAAYGEMFKLSHEQMPIPHYFLGVLGILPQYQGHGLGGRLIEPIALQAEKEHLSLYLESTNPKNLRFYKYHGFVLTHEGTPPNSPPFFIMTKQAP